MKVSETDIVFQLKEIIHGLYGIPSSQLDFKNTSPFLLKDYQQVWEWRPYKIFKKIEVEVQVNESDNDDLDYFILNWDIDTVKEMRKRLLQSYKY